MTVHTLKSWPEFFEPVLQGKKRFELRRNDRDFQDGDHLVLREYEPGEDRFTGRELTKRVSYVMRGIGSVGSIAPLKGLSMGYAILGLEDIEIR
jgi:hypothetical protein